MFERKTACKRGHLRNPQTVYNSGHCKKCVVERQAGYTEKNYGRISAYLRDKYFRRKYGMTAEARDLRYMQQQGKCEICSESALGLEMDHDHASNQCRGLICPNCNKMLGYAKDRTDVLVLGASYLRRYGDTK